MKERKIPKVHDFMATIIKKFNTMRNTKIKFKAVTEHRGKVVDQSEAMPIDEAKEYASRQAEKMRAEAKAEWSVYLQCAIFTTDDQA